MVYPTRMVAASDWMTGHPEVNRRCAEYARLEREVESTLSRLADITKDQLAAFQPHDHKLVMRLDKELEEAVGRGRKERLARFGSTFRSLKNV